MHVSSSSRLITLSKRLRTCVSRRRRSYSGVTFEATAGGKFSDTQVTIPTCLLFYFVFHQQQRGTASKGAQAEPAAVPSAHTKALECDYSCPSVECLHSLGILPPPRIIPLCPGLWNARIWNHSRKSCCNVPTLRTASPTVAPVVRIRLTALGKF